MAGCIGLDLWSQPAAKVKGLTATFPCHEAYFEPTAIPSHAPVPPTVSGVLCDLYAAELSLGLRPRHSSLQTPWSTCVLAFLTVKPVVRCAASDSVAVPRQSRASTWDGKGMCLADGDRRVAKGQTLKRSTFEAQGSGTHHKPGRPKNPCSKTLQHNAIAKPYSKTLQHNAIAKPCNKTLQQNLAAKECIQQNSVAKPCSKTWQQNLAAQPCSQIWQPNVAAKA